MNAAWATGLAKVLRLLDTEIERQLAIVMIGGLVTSTVFTLLALPTFYLTMPRLQGRIGRKSAAVPRALTSSKSEWQG